MIAEYLLIAFLSGGEEIETPKDQDNIVQAEINHVHSESKV